MSDDLASLRVYKGKEPFSPLMIGCLLVSLGILTLLYLDMGVDWTVFLSASMFVSGTTFLFFGILRMRYPWLRLKGKYHMMLGLVLLIVGAGIVIGIGRAIAIVSMLAGVLVIIWGIKHVRASFKLENL